MGRIYLYPSGPPMRPKVGWLRGEVPWVVLSVSLTWRRLYVQVWRAWFGWTFLPAELADEED